MKKPIHETNRCKLFERIANEVWERIKLAHDVNIDLPEIGITSDILVDILQFGKGYLSNFDVYAQPGWNENLYGCDIEIYIETDINKYIMFALQAKILKRNNRYNTLRDSSDGTMQWDKLILLETLTGCKSYYLLYNGRNNFKYNSLDYCKNPYNEEQLGCSLVEPEIIKCFAEKKIAKGRNKNPKFEDIHPSYSEPWRILTCCYHDTKKFNIYSRDQILESNPKLKLISDKQEKIKEENIRKDDVIPFVQGNPLNKAFIESKWNADLRIVIKRTEVQDTIAGTS